MTTKQGKTSLLKSAIQACARWAGIPIDAGDGTAYNLSSRLDPCTQHAALRLSAVWACVSLLSDTIGSLPLTLYRKTSSGRVVADQHDLYSVFARKPNADMTSSQFIGATIATLLLRDAAYWEKIQSAGITIGLNFLSRDCLSVTLGANGEKVYRYTENGRTRTIPASRIVKLIGFSMDGKNGLSAIKYGANVFGAAAAAETAARTTFLKGLMQTVFFKYPTILKESQRTEARATIETLSGALNSGKPVIMEAGMEAGNIGINPDEAQLLESRAYSTEEICSWFRVQPFMIGRASQGQTNWGTGIEQQMIGFITFTLAPWLRRIEQAIEKDVLTPSEQGRYFVKFNLTGLLRGDSAARAAFYSSSLQNGWMNRNQARALEEMNDIPGGDIFTVQSNLVQLSALDQQPPDDLAAQDALKRWLGIDQKENPHEP